MASNEEDISDNETVWIPFVEPVPDFDEALSQWGIWWEVHTYGVGVLFFMITIYSSINVVCFFQHNVQQRAYYMFLNLLVILFSAERGVFMFLDPYNANGTLHPALAYLFLSIGLPCMTSAFYLIFIAWIKATKFRATSRIHKTRTMIIIIVIHFVLSIAFDVAAGMNLQPVALLILCQSMFIVWSLILAIMFFYLFGRIYSKTIKPRKELQRLSAAKDTSFKNRRAVAYTNPGGYDTHSGYAGSHNGNYDDMLMHSPGGYRTEPPTVRSNHNSTIQKSPPIGGQHSHPHAVPRPPPIGRPYSIPNEDAKSRTQRGKTASMMTPEVTIPLGAKLILATAILLVVIACLYLGGIFGCYTLQIIAGQSPEPWPWWGYEFCLRLCEIALCWTITIAATKPITQKLQKRISTRLQKYRSQQPTFEPNKY